MQFTNTVYLQLSQGQVGREAREAIHIRINNPALNCNMGKMHILEILDNFLEQMDLSMSLTDWETQTYHKVTFTLLFQVTSLRDQCVWQIK